MTSVTEGTLHDPWWFFLISSPLSLTPTDSFEFQKSSLRFFFRLSKLSTTLEGRQHRKKHFIMRAEEALQPQMMQLSTRTRPLRSIYHRRRQGEGAKGKEDEQKANTECIAAKQKSSLGDNYSSLSKYCFSAHNKTNRAEEILERNEKFKTRMED